MGRGNTNNETDPEETDKKPQYGCQLAPSLPAGVSFTDVKKQKWTLGEFSASLSGSISSQLFLGKAIGSGGFGDIYLCGRGDVCNEESEFVVKMEPHDNGPLFTEMHVLYRLGLEQHRADWKPRWIKADLVDILLTLPPTELGRSARSASLSSTAAAPCYLKMSNSGFLSSTGWDQISTSSSKVCFEKEVAPLTM